MGNSCCPWPRADPRGTPKLDSACWARALRAAGEMGKLELLPLCLRALAAEDTSCQFWAAFSAVLLGNRREALQVIESTALSAGPMSGRALELSLQAMSRPEGHTCLQKVAQKTCNSRR